jgi:hypothetical protein
VSTSTRAWRTTDNVRLELGGDTLAQAGLILVGTGPAPAVLPDLSEMTAKAEAAVNKSAAAAKSAKAQRALEEQEGELAKVSSEIAESRSRLRPLVTAGKLAEAEELQTQIEALVRRVNLIADRVAILRAEAGQAERELSSAHEGARIDIRHEARKLAEQTRTKALQAIAVAAGPHLDALLASQRLMNQIQGQDANDRQEAEKRRQAVAAAA